MPTSSAAQKRFPEDTSVQFNYLPALRGLFAPKQANPRKALESLQPAINVHHRSRQDSPSIRPVITIAARSSRHNSGFLSKPAKVIKTLSLRSYLALGARTHRVQFVPSVFTIQTLTSVFVRVPRESSLYSPYRDFFCRPHTRRQPAHHGGHASCRRLTRPARCQFAAGPGGLVRNRLSGSGSQTLGKGNGPQSLASPHDF